MNKEIYIGKPITQDSMYIIAEVGNQFNGDFDTAKKLIDVVRDSGADAVKFILWFPDEIMVDNPPYSYVTPTGTKTEPMQNLLNRFTLPIGEWADLREYALDSKVAFMATVLSPSSFEWGKTLMMDAYKISAWDWNFPDLYEWVAYEGKPAILDVGSATTKEIDNVMGIFKRLDNDNVILMHCNHADRYDQMNVYGLRYLRDRYDCLVGYSPAGLDDELDVLAIGNGACAIEKRLTLNRSAGVLHDALSKEPDEFKAYVERMKRLKLACGREEYYVSDRDKTERKKYYRHIVASEFIPKGSVITRDMLEAKRGEYGISPEYIWNITGNRSQRDIARNETIEYRDIQDYD